MGGHEPRGRPRSERVLIPGDGCIDAVPQAHVESVGEPLVEREEQAYRGGTGRACRRNWRRGPWDGSSFDVWSGRGTGCVLRAADALLRTSPPRSARPRPVPRDGRAVRALQRRPPRTSSADRDFPKEHGPIAAPSVTRAPPLPSQLADDAHPPRKRTTQDANLGADLEAHDDRHGSLLHRLVQPGRTTLRPPSSRARSLVARSAM